jgi:hypothetical protein
MSIKPVPARAPYSPTQFGNAYNRDEVRTAFGNLARSVPPTITRSVTAATTVTTADQTILADTTASNFAVTLLPAAQAQFLPVTIKNTGTGTLTITGTVDGSANPTLAQNRAMTVQSDGSQWFKIGVV